MIHLYEIKVVAVSSHGEERELRPVRDYLSDDVQSYLLYDKKGHVAGSLHAIETVGPDSLIYLYVNIEEPVKKIRYEFPRKKGECLFLTYQLQSYISNRMYFVHVKSKDDDLEINTAGQTYVSVTADEDAEIVIGNASTSDRLLQSLTRVVNTNERKFTPEKIRELKNSAKAI